MVQFVKTIVKFLAGLIGITVFFLYLSLGKPQIKWDEKNSNIHGVEIIFHQPMSYIHLIDEHTKFGFTKEEISFSKTVVTTKSQRYREILKYGGHAQTLDIEDKFTIIKTYRRKHNWLVSSFNEDARYAVLKAYDGTESIVSLNELTFSSKPELSKTSWTYGEI